MTTTLTTKLETETKKVDEAIEKGTTRIDQSTLKAIDMVANSSRQAIILEEQLKQKAIIAEALIADYKNQADLRQKELEGKFQDIDRLITNKEFLAQFNKDTTEHIAQLVSQIAGDAELRKAIAAQINSDAYARLDALADGKSPLNGAWVLNEEPTQPTYSLQIAKDRFLLVGRDRFWTFASFDEKTKTLKTDKIGAVGWQDESTGVVSYDWNSIVWKKTNAKWTRPRH